MVNTSSPSTSSSSTFPVEQTNQQVLKELKEKITMGVYKLGDLIVPQEFQKVFVKGGNIATEKFFISCRKIPLEEIRYELQHKCKK